MSKSSWYRALADGRLIAIHPGVARLPGTAPTREQRIRAAVLAAAPGALASHRSAAHLWGLPRDDDDPIDIILGERARESTLEGVVMHRPRDRLDLRGVRRRGIPSTNTARLLCDLGAVDAGAVVGLVGHLLATEAMSLRAMHAALLRHSRRGRHGVGALRAALEGWTIDGKPADSVLELAMRRLVERHGLPPMEFHPIVEGFEVDFRVVGAPVVVECDGWTAHVANRRQFERDRARDAELVAAGWIVVRFTYRQIVGAPAQTARRLRAVLQQWQSRSA
jgi:very-short-patch-repair endonuclease